MTPLEDIIRDEISRHGPIGVDRYMALCLSHPEHGYYMTRDPLGVAGDFTTAPEISQMFGELVGLWMAHMWRDLGAPERFNLVELGPGRGTLMADVLRVCQGVPGFLDVACVSLVETSPVLRDAQAKALTGHDVRWVEGVHGLDEAPLFVIANEFFDALPVKQYQRVGDIWLERVIDWQQGFTFALAKTKAQGLPVAIPDGAIVERSEAGQRIVGEISQAISAHGGAALMFDYGEVEGSGDTLQAVRAHQPVDPLQEPGSFDLTAHVNFGDLARSLGGSMGYLTTQGQFLKAMGIADRAEALSQDKKDATAQEINSAVHRLTDPGEMGTLFKAMAITKDGAQTPPGF